MTPKEYQSLLSDAQTVTVLIPQLLGVLWACRGDRWMSRGRKVAINGQALDMQANVIAANSGHAAVKAARWYWRASKWSAWAAYASVAAGLAQGAVNFKHGNPEIAVVQLVFGGAVAVLLWFAARAHLRNAEQALQIAESCKKLVLLEQAAP